MILSRPFYKLLHGKKMLHTSFNLLEFPGIHIDAIQPPVPSPVAHIDYSDEAVEYEKKLVQVTAASLLACSRRCSSSHFNLVILSLISIVRILSVSAWWHLQNCGT